ncbi:MAG: glycosyltransferase family 1 protein [Aeromicrobium sp.]
MLHSTTGDRRSPAAGTLRVASVPSSHVYVRHLSADDTHGHDAEVERLADPTPAGASAAQSQWWPPAMLEPGWVADHADEFDVFHLHFGFDARSTDELRDLVEALRQAGRPLVFTVHDLRNPHHTDRRQHDEQLDVLVPAADQLITLTQGAARDIRRRWGRDAVVIPHPHVVELDLAAGIRAERAARAGPFRVGLHVKSLRACMDAAAILPGLVRAVQSLPDAVLQVNGHRDVLEPGGDRFDASLAGLLADLGPAVDLRVHDFLTDDELWAYLGSLDVSVLPYRHGTHSGWLEACRDLGTSVVAPTCGHYADQAPVHSFLLEESAYDEETLVGAVRNAHDRPAPPVDLATRRRQRDAIAKAHRDIYARLVRR